MTNEEYVLRVLAAYERCDCYDELLWRVDMKVGAASFACRCSDTFWWATADAETIACEDLDLLERCAADLEPFDSDYLVSELFAARKRGMRPMRLWLATLDKPTPAPVGLRALFEACGPERDRREEG